MKFSSAYEPAEYETDIYAAWEAAGVFAPHEGSHFKLNQTTDVVETSTPDTSSVQPSHSAKRHANKTIDETFSIVMPPPNANGNLHIGHGLTIAIEDALTRYYRLKGRRSWYIPGADHAGFETWVVYERALEAQGKSRFDYPREELYAQVWNFVQEQRGNMELQLRALGTSCSWKDLTFTLDENVVRRVYDTFEKMWHDGMIYRGEKLVNFCTKHQTAFADIEVEHEDEKGTLWDIAYPYVERDGEIIVSTTRPETLFGDMAVAVNPEDTRYTAVINEKVQLPLTKREIPIITDEHAQMEYGTGAVKITPAHDYDDFEVGERHHLKKLSVIGPDGRMLPVCGPDYAGLTTEECRKKVLANLKEKGLLRGEKKITHAVAHCYKCGTVIEPMLREQWFVNTEKLAKTAITHLEAGEIKFHPESKKKVLINYLKGLKDWNISRQIPWGIAIPMFHLDHSADNIPSASSIDTPPEWIFDTRVNLHEIEVGGYRYLRDEDTFDTWFSSSHWPIVCTDWEENLPNPFYPLNIMETGADILFAWVARMIMMGLYVTGEVPFKEVYLHGLVLDEHGKKMSKSKGNVINPMEMVAKYGSDAFRLGILRGRSAGMNQAFSENSVVSGRNLCNKLWNVSRLVQQIVNEASPTSDHQRTPKRSYKSSKTTQLAAPSAEVLSAEISANNDTAVVEIGDLGEIRKGKFYGYSTENMGEDWICRELDECRGRLEGMMKEYRFAEAVELLYNTIWDKYADWFLESQKLYKDIELLQMTLEMLLKMLHPFAPFVTETIWQNLSWTSGMLIVQKWPERPVYDPISAENFERLRTIVVEVRGTLQRLPGGKKWALLYGDDSLVEDNAELVKHLAKVPEVKSCEGQPRGLRLALPGTELYLDVPEKIVKEYRTSLEQRILAVGRELDALNARMMNPNYVEKAPAQLVKETRDAISEKEDLIARLKLELNVI